MSFLLRLSQRGLGERQTDTVFWKGIHARDYSKKNKLEKMNMKYKSMKGNKRENDKAKGNEKV